MTGKPTRNRRLWLLAGVIAAVVLLALALLLFGGEGGLFDYSTF